MTPTADATPPAIRKAWSRQHPDLKIDDRDFYSMFRARGIKNVLIMGVHTNMCVLNRSFAIRHANHEQGTQLVIQHIEKYWSPTVLADQLLRALR